MLLSQHLAQSRRQRHIVMITSRRIKLVIVMSPTPAQLLPRPLANPAMEVSQRRSKRMRIFSCFMVFLDSNCLSRELLLFLFFFLAAADKGRDQAVHGEEDGEPREGNVLPRTTFSKAEVQESAFCFSRREEEWKKEESEDM